MIYIRKPFVSTTLKKNEKSRREKIPSEQRINECNKNTVNVRCKYEYLLLFSSRCQSRHEHQLNQL